MKKLEIYLFVIILGCSIGSNSFALERRLYQIPLFTERQWVKSGMFIEFPVKEYGVSVKDFLNQGSKLSPVEKALLGYLKGSSGKSTSKIVLSIHMGDRVWFLLEPNTFSEKKYYKYATFVKADSNRYVKGDGMLDYFESYAVFSVTQSLLNPDDYPALPLDAVNSLGSDRFRYVVKTMEDKTPIDVSKARRIVFHFKGHPLHSNIVKDDLSASFFKKHPALAFYRRYLQAWSSGTKEEVENFFAKPDTFKGMKRYIDGMKPSEFELHGKDVSNGAAKVRFIIEADPFYFIFYTTSKYYISNKYTKPDEGRWDLVRVYKDPIEGFKIIDWNTSNSLTRMFFETDLTNTVLKPMASNHLKQRNNK